MSRHHFIQKGRIFTQKQTQNYYLSYPRIIGWGISIGGFAKRAHPARARYLNVNLARRKRDLQPGGKEIEGGGRGGGGEEE